MRLNYSPRVTQLRYQPRLCDSPPQDAMTTAFTPYLFWGEKKYPPWKVSSFLFCAVQRELSKVKDHIVSQCLYSLCNLKGICFSCTSVCSTPSCLQVISWILFAPLLLTAAKSSGWKLKAGLPCSALPLPCSRSS